MRPSIGISPTIGRADFVLAVGVAICLASHAVRAQDAPTKVTIEVGDCVDLKSPDERLACFDRHVEAAKPNRDANPPVPAQTSAASTPPTAAQASAVSTPPTAALPDAVASTPAPATAPPSSTNAQSASAENAARSTLSQHNAAAKPDIVATVTELHETVPNAWLITLDNGQVWRQNIPQRFALKAGQRVTLRGTKWGTSYRLSTEALNGFIQVERVR